MSKIVRSVVVFGFVATLAACAAEEEVVIITPDPVTEKF